MTRQRSESQPVGAEAELHDTPAFLPRLGDLARDTSRGGRVGVVVTLPGQETTTYHLRSPGGGNEWSAPADGRTLRPVPARVTHVTLLKRDVVYDHRAQQGALAVEVHYEDGGTAESLLVLTPDQVELYHCQTERLISHRAKACEDAS